MASKTSRFYRRRKHLESKFEKEFEAEQELLRMERDTGVKHQPINDLKSDKDPFIDPDEATIVDVMKKLNLLSVEINQLNRRMDTVQKEVDDVERHVRRIERTMDDTLSTVEAVKDMVTTSDIPKDVSYPAFEFEAITNETGLNELDHRLATDVEYVTNITSWLKREIKSQIPCKRVLEAFDILFDRQFLPQCSWTGRSFTGPRTPISARTHILELVRAMGGNRFTSISDTFVKKILQKNLQSGTRHTYRAHLPPKKKMRQSDEDPPKRIKRYYPR